MRTHRAIIETGPGVIRRLCCGTGVVADRANPESIEAALRAIDDRVALVGERPIAVASLWADALRSVACPFARGGVVVHPSWWSASRVGVVSEAAKTVFDDVSVRPRSWLLARAAGADAKAAIVVEIAERMVVIGGPGIAAIPRRRRPHPVADEAAVAIASASAGVVVIDSPRTVTGASTLAAAIAAATRPHGRTVVEVDDARLARLARLEVDEPPTPAGDRARFRARTLSGVGAATVAVLATPAVITPDRHSTLPPPAVQAAPTTFLVEGRVAVAVPAGWPTRRVIAGPGAARVQVTSPSDPEVALHVTQSPVAGDTLSATAERLKRAIDAEPAGVFVDFNPAATSAGRPAVTYREVRAAHDVRWTVLLDGPVRISLGCQSRSDDEEAVRAVCEEAVRSAHAIE